MQAILYCSFNMGRHHIRVILALPIDRANIITNIMTTHVKTSIKYGLHQLFIKHLHTRKSMLNYNIDRIMLIH